MRDPFQLTADDLRRLAPGANGDIIAGIAAASALIEDYGLTLNELRLCHFLAQVAHETAGFATLIERGTPAYFARLYGARRDLGNLGVSDGARYRGRGLIQLTGRTNYQRYGVRLGLDLEGRPELAARPDVSLRIACEYWRQAGLNRLADANDIRAITRTINGGGRGLAERRRYFERALGIFTQQAPTPRRGLLRAGDRGLAVRRLQRRLRAHGHDLVIDGLFGRATKNALMAFQQAHGLSVDGVYGARSQRALAGNPQTSPLTQAKEKETTMDQWKSYLQSRTIWANLIALAAFGLSVTGFSGLTGETQAELVDAILQLIEAGGLVAGVLFRAVARDRLGPSLL